MSADIITTDGFQLQLGPDGACRILIGDPADPAAILTLSDDAASRLADALSQRHRTYEESRKSHGRAKH